MRVKYFLFIILSCILVASCNQTNQEQDIVNEMYPEEQTKIKNLVKEIFDCVKNKDIEQLESHHLYGPKFTRYSDESPERFDAEGTRKLERESVEAMDEYNLRIENLKVDVFGRVAVATGTGVYDLKMGEFEISGKNRGTFVFVKVEDEWKITHEHFSPFPPTANE